MECTLLCTLFSYDDVRSAILQTTYLGNFLKVLSHLFCERKWQDCADLFYSLLVKFEEEKADGGDPQNNYPGKRFMGTAEAFEVLVNEQNGISVLNLARYFLR